LSSSVLSCFLTPHRRSVKINENGCVRDDKWGEIFLELSSLKSDQKLVFGGTFLHPTGASPAIGAAIQTYEPNSLNLYLTLEPSNGRAFAPHVQSADALLTVGGLKMKESGIACEVRFKNALRPGKCLQGKQKKNNFMLLNVLLVVVTEDRRVDMQGASVPFRFRSNAGNYKGERAGDASLKPVHAPVNEEKETEERNLLPPLNMQEPWQGAVSLKRNRDPEEEETEFRRVAPAPPIDVTPVVLPTLAMQMDLINWTEDLHLFDDDNALLEQSNIGAFYNFLDPLV
jgi:hypothetical protein